jgi:hypothetical protein
MEQDKAVNVVIALTVILVIVVSAAVIYSNYISTHMWG